MEAGGGACRGGRKVWGKEEGVQGQTNCVGREEIASKAERTPHVERGHPEGLCQGNTLLGDAETQRGQTTTGGG